MSRSRGHAWHRTQNAYELYVEAYGKVPSAERLARLSGHSERTAWAVIVDNLRQVSSDADRKRRRLVVAQLAQRQAR